MTIPSIYVLSNPLGSLSKLLFTNQPFINENSLKVHGLKKERLEDLILMSQERLENLRLIKSLEKYRLYMEDLDSSLNSFKNKHIIFLDFLAPTLVSKEKTFSRQGVDDFNGLNRFPDYLIEQIYMQSSPKVQEALRDEIIFWRLSPYDFPFNVVNKKNLPMIKNLFSKQAKNINSLLEQKGKSGFGNQTRLYEEHMSEGNYKFSPVMYSVASFRNSLNLDGSLKLLHYNYEKVYGSIKQEDLVEFMEGSARINFSLLKQKYEYLLTRLQPKRITAYMMKNTKSYDLLSSLPFEIEIPGKGLSTQTKKISLLGELDISALRRLNGYLRALYDPFGLVPEIEKIKKPCVVKEDRSQVFPYSINLGKSDIDKEFEKYDEMDRFFLEQDIKNFQFGVQSIESIIYDLNTHDFPVNLPTGQTGRLRELFGEKKINPFDIRRIAKKERGFSRPSNSSSKCPLRFAFSIQKYSFWPKEIKENIMAKSGHALHHLGNEVKTKQNMFLKQIGLKSMPRTYYCEVPLSYKFTLTNKQWEELGDFIEFEIEKTDNDFFKHLKDYYFDARNSKKEFVDGGRPDGVLIVEEDNAPMIVDFKRRMKGYYPTPSFFVQTSRYALALKHNFDELADHFYLNIVQRPFSPNQYLGSKAKIDTGNYRKPVQVIKKVKYESDFVDKVYERVAYENLSTILITQNKDVGLKLRDLYNTDLPILNRPWCEDCFSNKKDDFSCNYFFTGEKTPW